VPGLANTDGISSAVAQRTETTKDIITGLGRSRPPAAPGQHHACATGSWPMARDVISAGINALKISANAGAGSVCHLCRQSYHQRSFTHIRIASFQRIKK
jgi:hypothetical protein